MSALGLKIIDDSVHQANAWINEVDYRSGLASKQRSYRVLRAVLHAVRDHLSHDEAADLAAQMPMIIRGLYYEGWQPSRTPVRERSRDGFVARVAASLQGEPEGEIEAAIGAVLDVLDNRISEGEMAHIRQSFGRRIRDLFAD